MPETAQALVRTATSHERPGPEPSVLRLPPVIGHRGAAGRAPENTLASIRKARELGAEWVEFDVKLTRDGHAILKHDERLERTTDGFGKVADTDLVAIRRLDAGGWFGDAYRGERIPTLAEALALCTELGLGINLEIKPCRGREAETARVAVEMLLALWPAHMPRPLISSFAPECLQVARQIAPHLPRGYLSHRLPRRWREVVEEHHCATLHLNHRRISGRQRAAVIAAGVPLLLFTVNHARRARQYLERGVTATITDYVDDVRAALA